MIDLISERAGGEVVACNDEFFAEAANLIKTSDPIANDEYTDRGKWMDGWETRRRREPGNDWCVIALGIPGLVRRVTLDTSHFTGNYPARFSLDAAARGPGDPVWTELIGLTDLEGDTIATFDVTDRHRVELVRLNIYPDGGVARLRVEGEPIPAMPQVCPQGQTDLASALAGGEVVDASDLHYSHPANILRPVDPAGMWDGWETRRRRDDGNDWVIVRLGLPGRVEAATIDTRFFKGNAPGWVSLETSSGGSEWVTVVDHVPVGADQVNDVVLEKPADTEMVRLSIYPDGGVARLRLLGVPRQEAATAIRLRYLNSLFDQAARGFFSTACKSTRWVQGMLAGRPFPSIDAVHDHARSCFDTLDEEDWLEAFAGHPRIGEQGDAIANREQAGAAGHEQELAQFNTEYEERFGFTYIVYATGKTGDELLDLARGRLGNSRAEELSVAAGEQREITTTRLRRMLCQEVT